MQERLETYAAIETYLQEVSVHLRKLPPSLRDEELRELRQHLLILVQAGSGLNDSEDEAVQAALRQFGAPRHVGRDLMSAWNRRQNKQLWLATGCGYATGWVAMVPWSLYSWVMTGSANSSWSFQSKGDWWQDSGFYLFLFYSFLAMPFSCGWVASMVSPRQGVRAVVLLAVMNAVIQTVVKHDFSLTTIVPILIVNFVALIAGIPGALCGAWWKRRRDLGTTITA